MENLGCYIIFVLIIIFSIAIGISNGMSKLPPKTNEKIVGMPFGAKFKNDCNDDESWVG